MKLATFETEPGIQKIGALGADGQLIDLYAAAPLVSENGAAPAHALSGDMIRFLEGGESALDMARMICAEVDSAGHESGPAGSIIRYAESEVRLRAPIPRPLSIRDFSCVEEHYQGARDKLGDGSPIPRSWYDWPPFYKASTLGVVGPGDDVIWPDYAEEMDYELEVALVIGKRGKDIPIDEARDHIAGFTIFNDMTVRNVQTGEWATHVGFSKSKDFDTGNIFGPYLVTIDEFDGKDAVGTVVINGEVRAVGNLNKMYHSWERLIEHTSQSETLHPGEIFGSGSIGKGSGMELGRYLSPGDTVELRVEGLGILSNRVVKP